MSYSLRTIAGFYPEVRWEFVGASLPSQLPWHDAEPERKYMPVSLNNFRLTYNALKECDIHLLSLSPEIWLVPLIRFAEEDRDIVLVQVAKEEEGIGFRLAPTLPGASPPC